MEIIARNRKQVGAAIRRFRKQQGLTQSMLAQRMHTRQATVSTLEKGDAAFGTVVDALTALNLEIIVRERSKTPLRDFLEDTA
jgi:transcriptional regulator with XRE-family HTH domain